MFIGAMPAPTAKLVASVTRILPAKYSLPPATSELILLAIELKTTSAQIPIVMPRIVSVVRSLRRDELAQQAHR